MTATGSGSLLTATPFGKPELPSTATGGPPGPPATSAARSASRSPCAWRSRSRWARSSAPGPVRAGVQVAGVRVRVDAGAVEVPVPAGRGRGGRPRRHHLHRHRRDHPGPRGRAQPGRLLGDRRARGPGPPGRPPAPDPARLGAFSADRARLDAAPIDVVLTRRPARPATASTTRSGCSTASCGCRRRGLRRRRAGRGRAGPADPVVDRLAGRLGPGRGQLLLPLLRRGRGPRLPGPGRRPGQRLGPGRPRPRRMDRAAPARRAARPRRRPPVRARGAGRGGRHHRRRGVGQRRQAVPGQPQAGQTRVDFPATRVRRLRLTIDKVAGLGGQVRVSELRAGRARTGRPGQAAPAGLRRLATVDGEPLQARLAGTVADLAAGEALPVRGCGGPLRLGGGEHRVRPAPAGWSTCSGCRRRPRRPRLAPAGPRRRWRSPTGRRRA